jgi:hypothetical protein
LRQVCQHTILNSVKIPTQTSIPSLARSKSDRLLRLRDADGRNRLSTRPSRFFGQHGKAPICEFAWCEGDEFDGMGEKWTGFEHSGETTKF